MKSKRAFLLPGRWFCFFDSFAADRLHSFDGHNLFCLTDSFFHFLLHHVTLATVQRHGVAVSPAHRNLMRLGH
jgi:hypothetical protein